MGSIAYRRKLRALKARFDVVVPDEEDQPRLLSVRYCGDYARQHQVRVLTEQVEDLE